MESIEPAASSSPTAASKPNASVGGLEADEAAKTKFCDFCQSEIPFKALRCRYCSATLSKKSSEDDKGFSVEREETQESDKGFTEKLVRVSVSIHDETLKANLRCYMNDNALLLDKTPKLPADELFAVLPTLRQVVAGSEDLAMNALIAFLEREYEEQAARYERMLSEGRVSFDALQFVFSRGKKISARVYGSPVGSTVIETAYARTLFGTTFVITGDVVKSNGSSFFAEQQHFSIEHFNGLRSMTDLSVQPLTETLQKKLEERGQRFAALAIGPHYCSYKGHMLYKTPFYLTQFKADGRVMIDGTSFNKSNPNYGAFTDSRRGGGADSAALTSLPNDALYKTWPTVGAFSFGSKKWGELLVENTSDITFDDTAFERLVLAGETKSLLRALIEHTPHSFHDIIAGKGAGCIFALHGPPGTGKTVTAEAIAELLHRPLYSVAVGELGTSPRELETALRDILELAAVWNAVVLIDEADIFLERRTAADVQRNAMVGIFLRLLEYHQGILFLTTNRVDTFDEAFHSRISVALHYQELDSAARAKVWHNLLELALPAGSSLGDLKLDRLSQHLLNGRQIRNALRLAQALARDEKTTLQQRHLDRVIQVTEAFQPNSRFSRIPTAAALALSVSAAAAMFAWARLRN